MQAQASANNYLAPMWFIIPFSLLLCYVILLLWYRQAWLKLPLTNAEPSFNSLAKTKVSIIVPARNESANIANCINSILAQTYPSHLLELVIMDDASDDDTVFIAKSFETKDNRIKVYSLLPGEAIRSHKKRAVEKGIQLATGDLIVATDADCIHPVKWIETIVKSFQENGNIFIAAPVMYHTERTVCSVFQTLDFISLQGITGASVHKRFHTMCNGANIGYSRNVFYEVKGFEGIDALPTGDDMLLMHKIFIKHPGKVIWLKSKDALVLTDAAPSWKAFFQQRIRWASKAAFFDDKRIFYVLLLVYLVNAGFLITAFASVFSIIALKALLVMLVIKTIAELWFLFPVAAFFNKTKWLWAFPLMQPLHIIYTVVAGWLGRFGKYEWKGRVIGRT